MNNPMHMLQESPFQLSRHSYALYVSLSTEPKFKPLASETGTALKLNLKHYIVNHWGYGEWGGALWTTVLKNNKNTTQTWLFWS